MRRGGAEVDYGIISGVMTAILLAAFLGVLAWAWSRRRRADFEAAARLALREDDGGGR